MNTIHGLVRIRTHRRFKLDLGISILGNSLILSKALFTHDMIDPKLPNYTSSLFIIGKQVVVQDLDCESELVTAVPELNDDSAVMRCVLDVSVRSPFL